MRHFGLFCSYAVNALVVLACGMATFQGVYRVPMAHLRTEYGPFDVWMGLGLGVPALIGAITALVVGTKR